MSSSRRVKKGPGRRPQSAKRQRFMELRARGWSIRAAGHEVGISRTAADLRQCGLGVRAIAARLGRAPSTISRELRRNSEPPRTYRPINAHRLACARRSRHRQRRVGHNDRRARVVGELLSQRWSAQQSADTYAAASPTIRPCGYALSPSIKLCTNLIRRSCAQRRWLRIDGHRYAQVEIVAEHTSITSAVDHGVNNPCSPSVSAPSLPLTVLKSGTGTVTSSSTQPPLSDRHARRAPYPDAATDTPHAYTSRAVTPTRSTPRWWHG